MPDTNTKPVALVTGSSRGIGAATARKLAADGFRVIVNYRRNQQLALALVATLKQTGSEAIAVGADVSQETEVEKLFSEIDKKFGHLDLLVNNAALMLPQSRVVDMRADRINRMLTTNVTSCFLCAREAIARMSTKHGGRGGSIVNVSSAAARLGAGGEYVDYAASKGAIDTLTRGLATELASEGIRVNCVRPGFIYTDMHSDGGEPGRVDRLKSSVPLGRGGYPEEVAAAVAWLASSQSSYTTGAFIEVSGGR